MNTHNTYYKLATLEALDSLYYPFYYQGYDANYPVLQESAGALGLIGTRLICNIAFKDRQDTQAKIAHALLPIIVGFGLYFVTAKKRLTLQEYFYNYSTQILSHTLRSFIHFTPQKSIETAIKEWDIEKPLKFLFSTKKKEEIGDFCLKVFNSDAFKKPKDLPEGWVDWLSEILNGGLKFAAERLLAPVAQHIVAEKVDLFVASILGTIAAHYAAPWVKQIPIISRLFASEGPSKISPMFLAIHAFSTAIKEDIERSLWTSESKS